MAHFFTRATLPLWRVSPVHATTKFGACEDRRTCQSYAALLATPSSSGVSGTQ